MIAHPPPPIRGHDRQHHATVNGKRCLPCDRGWARVHKRPRATGSSTGFVIPYYIVYCESKGTNEGPNGPLSAAGYYQIIPSTWREYGGSPPDDASQHSKAEQDAVAARIWDGGRGAGQWACS